MFIESLLKFIVGRKMRSVLLYKLTIFIVSVGLSNWFLLTFIYNRDGRDDLPKCIVENKAKWVIDSFLGFNNFVLDLLFCLSQLLLDFLDGLQLSIRRLNLCFSLSHLLFFLLGRFFSFFVTNLFLFAFIETFLVEFLLVVLSELFDWRKQ